MENVTCSRPQLKVPQLRIAPGTAKTGINHSTPASVRSTIYLHILRRSISDHHLKLLCEMPSVIFYTNRNMPLHPKLWGRAGIMTFQFSVPCNKSTPLSQETLEVKPMIFALPHWGKDNTVKTWHLPCTAAAGTKLLHFNLDIPTGAPLYPVVSIYVCVWGGGGQQAGRVGLQLTMTHYICHHILILILW